jgi:hypothetical protein
VPGAVQGALSNQKKWWTCLVLYLISSRGSSQAEPIPN